MRTALIFGFGWLFGILFGIQIGLLLSMIFKKWSRSAATWIMKKYFKSYAPPEPPTGHTS